MDELPVVTPGLQALPASLSAGWVHDALATVGQVYGITPQSLLDAARLPPGLLADPTTLVSLVDVVQLFAQVLVRTGDHALGLRLGAAVQVRSFPVLGHAILGSRTLGEAVERLLRYERVVGELGRATLEERGAELFLRWDCPVPMPYARYLRESALAGWVSVARQLVDGVQAPLAAHFEHAEPDPPQREVYAQAFGCPVLFAQPATGILIAREWLQLPVRLHDPALGRIMDEHAARLLADFSGGLNLANEVRSLIFRRLSAGEPEVDDVAADLGLTGRALQARLRKGGLTFSELVDDVRRVLAASLVADPRLALVNIAFLLGFSEQSSFTRAFRRWYGVAPGEFRRGSGPAVR